MEIGPYQQGLGGTQLMALHQGMLLRTKGDSIVILEVLLSMGCFHCRGHLFASLDFFYSTLLKFTYTFTYAITRF